MELIIPKKFTEKHIDSFINDFYKNYTSSVNDEYLIDFTKTEWISNQNLLLLSGIIKYLYKSNHKFKIKLFKDDINSINKKQAKQIFQIWEVWKMNLIFDEIHFENYVLSFRNETIPYLIEKFKLHESYNLFDRFEVTPFVSLNYINDYKDEDIIKYQIKPVFKLNDVIKKELKDCNSEHPFIENTLSLIIVRELYENFLNHHNKTFFNSDKKFAFLSIALKKEYGREKFILSKKLFVNKIDSIISYLDKIEIEYFEEILIEFEDLFYIEIDKIILIEILNRKVYNSIIKDKILSEFEIEHKKNVLYRINRSFEEEELLEAKSFFYRNSLPKNENIIQFSFLDFGVGIAETLREEYKKELNITELNLFDKIDDNEVLKFAFRHNSSCNPIIDKYNETDNFIPRGLFDLLVIVKRYKGLLLARSNFGKILYDFSNTDRIENAYSTFGNPNEFFPGTFISIYIPSLPSDFKFNKTVIKPDFYDFKLAKKSININLFSILTKVETVERSNRYKKLIIELKKSLLIHNENRLNYISFYGVEDYNIIEKTIFFLLTDYEINEFNSVLILFPPSIEIINKIKNEILELNSIIKNYKIHPIPLVYLNKELKEIELDWLGVYDIEDKKKLNDLLFGEENYSLALSDFKEDNNILGNINMSDKFGNIKSKLPKKETLLTYYKRFESNLIKEAIERNNCLKKDESISYLCNGNYYQNEFLQISDLLNEKVERDIISRYFYDKIFDNISLPNKSIKYIAITASSQKILYSLISQQKIKIEDCIFFDNYLNFEIDTKNINITEEYEYILICDVLSTGNLTKRIDKLIQKRKSNLLCVAVIVNTLDPKFDDYESFIKLYRDKLIYLYNYPITKTKIESFKKILRINPYTNLPITLSENTEFSSKILLSNEEFLECIFNQDIKIKFCLFNNIIHPYFFSFKSIIERENTLISKKEFKNSIIYKIFEKLKFEFNFKFETNDYIIFFPKNSDIQTLDFESLKSNVLGNDSIEYFQLERYNTGSGWKFPHTTEFFGTKINEKPKVLIIDDGSCSGDSLLQMINEISLFNPTQIDLICILGRIEDHKREFLSKISNIRSSTNKDIKVSIYFGSHWHIPTFYIDNNPYSDEINLLNNIIKFQNTPFQIKQNAEKIKSEIEAIPFHKELIDYPYFPKYKETNDNKEIPKKEILLVRNEIGKITGYRFYKESFNWFNQFVISIKNKNNLSKNKSLEEIIMCFLYEPYLYDIIIQLIPDLRNILESFVESIIFKKSNWLDLLANNFYYDWRKNKTDIVHLYFIIYKNERLISNLTLDRFKDLIEFAGDNKTNYILFKLLYYSEFNKNQKGDFFIGILNLIDAYLQIPKPKNQIKLFRYFISTLSFKDSFDENLSFIFQEYKKINNAEKHKEAITAKFGSSISYLDLLIEDNSLELLYSLKEELKPIMNFIQKILTLSSSYPSYFSKYLNHFEIDSNSLSELYKMLYYSLINLDKNSNFKLMKGNLKEIQERFLGKETIPYKILINTITDDFYKIFLSFKESLEITHQFNIKESTVNSALNFPKFLFEEIVFNEIFENLKAYSDEKEKINIDISNNLDDENKRKYKLEKLDFNNYTVFKIINKIKNGITNNGSSLGTHYLTNLNEYPNESFKFFSRKINNDKFYEQIIIIQNR